MGHLGLRQRRQYEPNELHDDTMEAPQRRRHYESYELDESTADASVRRKRRASAGNATTKESVAEDLDIVATFCGRETSSARLFGVLFPSRSYPLDASNFTQVDPTHWVLDMSIFVGESYDEVKDICIFLVDELSIPPEKALALYVQSPGSHFQYCGAVCQACPSAVLLLLWPNVGGQRHLTPPNASPLTAKIGLAVEDVATLPTLNVGKQRQLEAVALRVGENLLNFMQFFSCGGDKFVAPLDILNKWFSKFQEKLRRDSEYIKSLLA